MDVLLSGQAATAVTIEGADIHIMNMDAPSAVRKSNLAALSYVFRGCTDVVHLKGTNIKKASAFLEQSWKADRALRLLLIALDDDEYAEVREEAVEEAENLLSEPAAQHLAKKQFLGRTLPQGVDIQFAIELAGESPAVRQLFELVRDRQERITQIWEAWDAIPASVFGSTEDKELFEGECISRGAFSLLSDTTEDVNNINSINLSILKVYTLLRDLPNHREVVTAWTSRFKQHRKSSSRIDYTDENDIDEGEFPAFKRKPGQSRYAFENALHQQQAIFSRLRTGNVEQARRYTDELIRFQMKSSGREHVAKSLCRLSQEAKRLGIHTLHLEWAQRAVDICPDDSWAHGQAADAYIYFYRLDEALTELSLAETYGDDAFASIGRARVLRHQGKLDEALQSFRTCERVFSSYDHVWHAWRGAAETLRDMWKLEDALLEYEKATTLFPNEPSLKCGQAAVLTDMGRLDDAASTYERVRALHGDEVVAMNGRATVLKHKGLLDDAIEAYEEAIRTFPGDPAAKCGLADVLKLKGKFDKALAVYRDIRREYPYLPAAYGGYAEILRERGEVEEAIIAYEKAESIFENDPWIANGLANAYKACGKYEEALRLYDRNAGRFPYDLITKSSRADLLKRLGHYDRALEAYDQIIGVWGSFASARHAKAAILVATGKYAEAAVLLPEKQPSTEDEWIAYHVRGMAMLRQGKIENAINHFTAGALQTPFAKELKYMNSALAIAKIMNGKYDEAIQANPLSNSPITNVIYLHALAGSGRTSEARSLYNKISSSDAEMNNLRDEIAAHFNVIDLEPRKPISWLVEQESEFLLRYAA